MSDNKYDLEIIRHSLAHVMAAAIQKLYPDAKFAGGPSIENGFYYDFDTSHKFSPEDFAKIEKEMRDIIKSNGRFEQKNVSPAEAREIFKNQPFKLEWVSEKGDGEILSIYSLRDFTDLCRGPHVESTKDLPRDSFKLRNVAGAYWRGDSKNQMLQRIYADAFLTREDLEEFLEMQILAEARDNRKLGREMDLFHFEPDYAPGAVFWHDKGFRLYRKLIDYIRARQEEAGYLEISTPSVMDRSLWETSGHWAKYGEHNYSGQTQDGRTFCVKPMSCPGGMLVFGHGQTSYKDLPMYVAEFGKVNRFEAAGGLSGLKRVREFTQDDAHIFCTEEQLEEEIIKVLRFIKDVYAKFGFDNVTMKLATRKDSEFRIGDDAIWDKTEGALRNALIKNGLEFEIAEQDAAFYGPKIDNYLRDSMGRVWQCGTLQLDMSLPERFNLSYIGEDGQPHRPIMLHRAMLGSIERFMGILLESTGGNLPIWLSPEPVVIAPVSEKFKDYANEVLDALKKLGVRARADNRDEKVNYKIRDLSLAKTPIIAVVGASEASDKTVSLRYLGSDEQEIISLADFVSKMAELIKMPL